MERARRIAFGVLGAVSWIAVSASGAAAQSRIDPTTIPERNDGGWIFWLAWLCGIMGIVLLVFLVVMYMRYAPGFRREESPTVVLADRVTPGIEPPRRAVDLSQAAPIVVQPPPLPAAVAAASVAATATAVAEAPAAEAPRCCARHQPRRPLPRPGCGRRGSRRPRHPRPHRPAERVEVTMDQEAYDTKLAELLEAGTDRRVAEGQARRAGMIAARKKAEGEG